MTASTNSKLSSKPNSKLAQGVAQRLRELVQDTLQSQYPDRPPRPADFARLCDIPDPSLRNYLNGKSIPGGDNLAAIARATGVSVDWLLTGEGARYRSNNLVSLGSESSNAGQDENDPSNDPTRHYTKDLVLIPFFDVMASAGGGAFVDEEARQVFPLSRQWIRQRLGVPPGVLNLIRVQGDSMEPTLEDGDDVFVDCSASTVERILEGIYVLRIDGYLRVKRLERLGHRIAVRSDNPNYSSEVYDLNTFPLEFTILGRVVATLRAV